MEYLVLGLLTVNRLTGSLGCNQSSPAVTGQP